MRPIPVVAILGLAMGLLVPLPAQGQEIASIYELDTDGDRKVSKAEYIAARDKKFGRYDRNGDGSLGAEDFPNASAYRRALGRIEDRISDADKNGDNLLSREEMHDAPTFFFDRSDFSKDGYVSERELTRARQQWIWPL